MTLVPSKNELNDVQADRSHQNIDLNRVGISDFKLPLTVADRANQTQQVVARTNFGVNLIKDQRGAHLSRFIELAEEYRSARFTLGSVAEFLRAMQQRLDATDAYARFDFDYFVPKNSPRSGKEALVDYDCGFGGRLIDDTLKIWIRTAIPLTSLCPCSKSNSPRGAHNQRAIVKSKAVINGMVWLEEMISMVEAEGSSQVYSLLKREDEAFLTDEAYDNPKFVEDIVRDLSLRFQEHQKIRDFTIQCVSYESIHNHNAYAAISHGDFWRKSEVV